MNIYRGKDGRFTFKEGYKPVKFSHECKNARKLAQELINKKNEDLNSDSED